MKQLSTTLGVILLYSCLLNSCKRVEKNSSNLSPTVTTPAVQVARIDMSHSSVRIDIEKAIESKTEPLKLSQIASTIKYYPVGDSRYTVTQAISVPDSDAFITLNFPRIYYRKRKLPSKRYAFKALDYAWHTHGRHLFFDKKTTQMYVALSGADKNNKTDSFPYICKLAPLDSMLTTTKYITQETENKYPVPSKEQLIGFSPSGYTTYYYEDDKIIPSGIRTYSLEGKMLCQFELSVDVNIDSPAFMEQYNGIAFHTSYWNQEQDQMSFMIPFINTVYKQKDPQTIEPLYDIHLGKYTITDLSTPEKIESGKIHIQSLSENPKGVFLGLYQKDAPPILNWLNWVDEYKPELTHQVVYLKENDNVYLLSGKDKGFINDLDGGLTFWPDGQTDDCLYMIRTVTEMRETINRVSKDPKQLELMEFLDNADVKERYYVMIVVE